MRHFLKFTFLLATTGLTLTASDPFLGSWRLVPAKSTSSLKDPPQPPKALVVTYARQGEDVQVTTDITLPDGKKRTVEHVSRYDGLDYPRYIGAPAGDTIANKRIDKFTEESAFKKDGKVTILTRRVISRDGQTMTATARSTAPDGGTVETVTVFEKLPARTADVP